MIKLNLVGSLPTYTNLITLVDAKNFLRVTDSAEDSLITSLITASIETAENYTNSRFLDREYLMNMETWDDVYVSNFYSQALSDGSFIRRGGFVGKSNQNQIVLPYPPLDSVTHIKYYDASNTQVTFSSSNYIVNTFINQKGFIEIKDGVTLPTLKERADAIEIKFKTGYGTSSSDTPEAIKTAILLILGFMYEKREDTVSRLPKASEYLLDPYRFKTY